MSAALLILLIAAFLRAQSASQACDASPLPDEAMPILPPSSGIIRQSLTPLTPSTLSASEPASAADQMCRQGRSRPIHGSGATVCYEGYTGAIKRHLDFFPGDGACASCSGSNDADACTACYPGFSLLVTDPEKCSGMCVMSNGSEATAPPASSCIPQQAGGSLQGCLKHDDQPLCYDLQDNCKFRVAWDDGLCVGHLARACKATCGQCGEPSGSDPHLRALLLAWRSTLTLGPGSPLGWGWKEDKALDEWPGVSTGSAISGGFLKELCVKLCACDSALHRRERAQPRTEVNTLHAATVASFSAPARH